MVRLIVGLPSSEEEVEVVTSWLVDDGFPACVDELPCSDVVGDPPDDTELEVFWPEPPEVSVLDTAEALVQLPHIAAEVKISTTIRTSKMK